MKEIEFICFEDNKVNSGILQYINVEQSFYYEPWQENDVTLLFDVGFLGLDVNTRTGCVAQISGLCSKKLWHKANLLYPASAHGKVFVNFKENIVAGTGIQYANDWKLFFSEKNNVFCIGKSADIKNCSCIEVVDGISLAIRDKELISIWGKVFFV